MHLWIFVIFLTDIPLFGLMTKEDLVNFEDKEIQDREREFLQSLGIDQTASYSRWQNNPTGDFSCRVLYFLDRLLSPEVRVVLDQIIFIKRWIGSAWENPSYALLTLLLSALGFIAIFWASVYLNLYFWNVLIWKSARKDLTKFNLIRIFVTAAVAYLDWFARV